MLFLFFIKKIIVKVTINLLIGFWFRCSRASGKKIKLIVSRKTT